MKINNFSPLHDILILNDDGSYSHMDEPYFESEPIGPGIWKIISDGDYSYLVEGDLEAILIDTGYGCGNIREYCQTLTDKPLRFAANTHHHFDHSANNCYFEGTYMSKAGIELATIPYPSFEGMTFETDYPHIPIEEGDVIDLGGRTLEVIEIPCHAVSGVAFLDVKGRFLFASGEICCPGSNINGSVVQFVKNHEKLLKHRYQFDHMGTSHGLSDAGWVEKSLDLAWDILEKKPIQVVPKSKRPGPLTGPNGERVYKRRVGRYEDIHQPNPYMIGVTKNGCTLRYDTRNTYECTVFND